MGTLLHEGHEHADSAAGSGVDPELIVLVGLGILVFAIVASYGIKRYAGS